MQFRNWKLKQTISQKPWEQEPQEHPQAQDSMGEPNPAAMVGEEVVVLRPSPCDSRVPLGLLGAAPR